MHRFLFVLIAFTISIGSTKGQDNFLQTVQFFEDTTQLELSFVDSLAHEISGIDDGFVQFVDLEWHLKDSSIYQSLNSLYIKRIKKVFEINASIRTGMTLANQNSLVLSIYLKDKRNLNKESESALNVDKSIVHQPFLEGTQVFEVQDGFDIDVRGKNGAVFFIKRKDLMTADGKAVDAAVKVELNEFLDASSILKAGLETTSEGRLLETGGMLHLNLSAEGEQLYLKPGCHAKIKVPVDSGKASEGMDLFVGTENDSSNLNWTIQSNAESNNNRNESDAESLVQLVETELLDSIHYYNFLRLPDASYNKGVPTRSLRDNKGRRSVQQFTHSEYQYDLVLPYINTPSSLSNRPQRPGIWINIDRYFRIDVRFPAKKVAAPELANIQVTLPAITLDSLDVQPTVYLKIKNRRAYIKAKAPQKKGQYYCYEIRNIPQNQPIELIAFGSNKSKWVFAEKSFVLEKKDATILLDISLSDQHRLDKALQQLD